MGIELVSPTAHERRAPRLSLHYLVGSLICFLRTLWTRLTRSYTSCTGDLSYREPLLLDCEKGPIDIYQTRTQLLAALKRRDASDAAFEAQVSALLAPVRSRLAEITRDSGVPYPDPHDPDLPPAPQIFYGRIQELTDLVEILTPPRQARVVLLGESGAGTSALALALLHRTEIVSVFGTRRFLVRCANADAGEALAAAVGVDSRHAALAALARCPFRTLLVFDAVHDDALLADLSHMPRVSLLLTARVSTVAVAGYTTIPVGPLPLPAARALFRAIADLPAATPDENVQLVDISVPPSDTVLDVSPLIDVALSPGTSSPSVATASDVALVDALLHHARCLPRGIVQLAQRAQYEPLPFLLARCVEEEECEGN